MQQRSPEMEDWVARARQIAVVDALSKTRDGDKVKLKRTSGELVGPCPACGGEDRFSINLRKNVFHCRKSATGGDAIALVMYLDGADFIGACRTLNGGEDPPNGESGRSADPELIERRRRDAEAAAKQRAEDENEYRSREIKRAHEIWRDAGKLAGSIAEVYLKFRGVVAPQNAKLRCASRLGYWLHYAGDWHKIHEGPAMVAAIQGPDDYFCGVHCTYIDPRLSTANGKVELFHPETGEILDAKKVRGSAKGGHIHLGGVATAPHLICGEGIETTLSPATIFGTEGRLYWATLNLGNMAGKAKGRVPHPTATRLDKRGHKRRVTVPDDEPAEPEDGEAVLMPPKTAREITLLGDGDSDRFTTELVLKRAARRWAAPGRVIRAAWAEEGGDLNSMLRRGAA